MAKTRMRDYQIFKCPFCACEYYDKTAREGKKVGNPMIVCPHCSKKSFVSTILEPAVISGKRYFDIRFSSLYGNLRIGLILIYAVFLFFILISRDFMLGVMLVGVAVALYAVYELVRICHRNSFLNSDEYDNEISESLERLSDTSYAKMIADRQGIDETSIYYYELYNDEEEDEA